MFIFLSWLVGYLCVVSPMGFADDDAYVVVLRSLLSGMLLLGMFGSTVTLITFGAIACCPGMTPNNILEKV